MKNSSYWIVPGVVLLVAAVSGMVPLHAEISMNEGNWESVTEITMEGMPFQIPSTKVTQCLTKENAIPGSDKEKNCKVLSQSTTGNKVTWKVRCVDKETTMEGEGEVTYSGSTYKGTMAMKMIEKGGTPQNMKMNLSGRRIGECTDKDRRTVSVGGREVQQMDSAQIEQMQARAQKAQAESEMRQKEQKARWEVLAAVLVPEEDPGSCVLSGQKFQDPNCDSKVGKLNLKPGEWEITTQEGQEMAGHPMVGDPKKTTQCLTHESPMISAIQKGPETKAARSSQKITWRSSQSDYAKIDVRGGIIYKGDTLEGAILRTQDVGSGRKIVDKAKISGRRIGDGNCLAQGRDLTSRSRDSTPESRDYTAKKRKTTPATPAQPSNPIKDLRKRLPF